jgi:hypothetical protein
MAPTAHRLENALQEEFNYRVSRLRAAVRALSGRGWEDPTFQAYRDRWHSAYDAELVGLITFSCSEKLFT